MTPDTVISALAGCGGAILGAGGAWGMLVQRVRALEAADGYLWDGLADAEARCKEREARIERDVVHVATRLESCIDRNQQHKP